MSDRLILKKDKTVNVFRIIRVHSLCLLFVLFFHKSNAQAELLDSTQLAGKLMYTSLRQALKNPMDVYKLQLGFRLLPAGDTLLLPQISKLKNLQVLEFSGDKLSVNDTMPEYITGLTNLEELSFSHTSFRYLPSSIGKLSNLKYVYITGSLAALPDEIGQLKKLKVLYIDFSGIAALPESIGDLAQLRELHLSYSNITAIPATIGKLNNLQILSVSGCKITSIPIETGSLKQLQKIKIESNSLLEAFPAELFYLSSLKELLLSGNKKATTFPADFHALKNLQRLEISNTDMQALPEMAGMDKLEYLTISGNGNLEKLPPSLNQLPSLKELVLKDNRITSLPEMNHLDLLSKISIREMKYLDWEPAMKILSGCKSLKILNISENEWKQFPENLSKLHTLEKLIYHAAYNSKTIDELNWEQSLDIISKLKTLKVLDLSGNKIKQLPASVKKLVQIDSLYLQKNNLTDLKSAFGILKETRLKALDLSSCEIRRLPDELGQMVTLQKLNVSANLIDSLPQSVGKLKNLKTLDLSIQGNLLIDGVSRDPRCLKYISPELYSLPALKLLNLSGNPCLKLSEAELRKQLPADCVLLMN